MSQATYPSRKNDGDDDDDDDDDHPFHRMFIHPIASHRIYRNGAYASIRTQLTPEGPRQEED